MAAKQRKILTELKREQVILQQEELDFISEAVGGCCTGRCQELLEQVGLSSKKSCWCHFICIILLLLPTFSDVVFVPKSAVCKS